MRKFICAALASILAPASLLAGPRRKPPSGPNVLLITVDTVRADHLSCYGYPRQTSPNIDRLASEGILFKRAYTPVPLTGPAHISLMTSLFPQQHGATINGMHMTSKPRPVTLAQIMHRLGYRTAAFVSAWPVKGGVTGLGRGFGTYNEKFTYHYKLVNAARTAEDVTTAALRWLKATKRSERPFFLWVHYFDPHEPYELHREFADLPSSRGSTKLPLPAGLKLDANEIKRVVAYDSEVAYMDHYLGELLRELSNQGLRKKTLILLLADHGESLGENGYWGHGDRLYQPIVHIPMILSYPGIVPQGPTISEDVGLLDVMPTILDYVGLPARLPLVGETLKPLVEAAKHKPNEKPVYFLTYNEPPLLPPRWISWIWTWAKTKMSPSNLGFASQNLKVVLEADMKRPHVYQLDAAAHLEQPIKDVDVAKLEAYGKQVNSWFQDTNRGLKAEGKLGQEDVEILRSLGYIGP